MLQNGSHQRFPFLKGDDDHTATVVLKADSLRLRDSSHFSKIRVQLNAPRFGKASPLAVRIRCVFSVSAASAQHGLPFLRPPGVLSLASSAAGSALITEVPRNDAAPTVVQVEMRHTLPQHLSLIHI